MGAFAMLQKLDVVKMINEDDFSINTHSENLWQDCINLSTKPCIFIIKSFRTIVFIVISKTFRPQCPPAFFRCLSNSGTDTELRTTSFIESTGVTCSDSVDHNRGQVLSIPALLLACSLDWTCKLQMIVSLGKPTSITVMLCVLPDISEWIFWAYKLNVLTWLGLLQLYMIFYLCSYSDLFFFI